MASNPIWNPARPDSLASIEGAGASEFVAPASGQGNGPGRLTERQGRAALLAIFLALGWLLYLYRDTALAMEAIWSRSDTFAHGYLVAPISLWLIWRRRETVRNVPLRPSVWGYLAGLVCGFTWLLAQLASVDVVAQFALIGMLIATVWALAGTTVTKALAFPLGFLVFCVPFGEFLFPTMMDWTADFVVGALRLTGIPVYVEGRSLVIPSGHWQVVEGCSGVRYLIASVVVGSLYAYLNYRSLARCLVFAAMAVVVPVLANWLRAYGIVLLGHVSDNKLATGVDHLVYGWAFFGIVILGLFWLGARWQEPEDVVSVPHKAGIAARQRPPIGFGVWMLAAVIGTVVLSLAHPALSWLDSRGQVGRVQFAPWVSDAGWVVVDSVGLPEWSPRYHGMVAEDRSAWGKEGRVVGVYLGYYRDQQPGRELINSENKVIQSKDPVWTLAAYGHRQVALPEGDLAVLSTEIRGPRGRLLVWHWYWIGGWVTSNDYVAKAFLALAKLAGRGDDSAVVMLHTPVAEDGLAQADQALADFARDLGPALSQRLATTAGH